MNVPWAMQIAEHFLGWFDHRGPSAVAPVLRAYFQGHSAKDGESRPMHRDRVSKACVLAERAWMRIFEKGVSVSVGKYVFSFSNKPLTFDAPQSPRNVGVVRCRRSSRR